jgi:hypothetical protein
LKQSTTPKVKPKIRETRNMAHKIVGLYRITSKMGTDINNGRFGRPSPSRSK